MKLVAITQLKQWSINRNNCETSFNKLSNLCSCMVIPVTTMAILIERPSLHFENLNVRLVSYHILITFISA